MIQSESRLTSNNANQANGGVAIHTSIVAPTQALRAGLRALLNQTAFDRATLNAAPTNPPSEDRGAFAVTSVSAGSVDILAEGASLAEVEKWLPEIDVLLWVAPFLSPDNTPGGLPGYVLEEAARRQQGQLAVLLLSDLPEGNPNAWSSGLQNLVDLPLRAWGVLSLDCGPDELQTTVRTLNLGLCVGAPALFKSISPAVSFKNTTLDNLSRDAPFESLTERESQVLQLLARGLANKQIAAQLKISEHTVKFHINSIYSKLNASNRTEAVRRGIQNGLVLL